MGKGGIEGKWSKDPITKARVIIIRNLLSLTSAKKHRARNFDNDSMHYVLNTKLANLLGFESKLPAMSTLSSILA